MKTHAPIHPGDVLREDFLTSLGFSEYHMAEVWLHLQGHHDQQLPKAEVKSAFAGIPPCPVICWPMPLNTA